jgi:hypothetical protein
MSGSKLYLEHPGGKSGTPWWKIWNTLVEIWNSHVENLSNQDRIYEYYLWFSIFPF